MGIFEHFSGRFGLIFFLSHKFYAVYISYRFRSIMLIFSALLLLTSGCSSSGGDEDKDESCLYGVLTSRVRALDPADIWDTGSTLVGSQIFESLYQYHYLRRPYEIVCRLADSEPQGRADGLVYTIRIKKGIYFADDDCFEGGVGRELKASDFVYAWKRIADIKNLSRNWWIFDKRIVGLDEFREYTKSCKSRAEVDYSREVEGLRAVDDYTLEVRLKGRWPQMKYFFARIVTAPVAKEAVDYYGDDIINHPVGTGPYRLKRWHRGSYIELVRNEKFRDEYYPAEGETSDEKAGYLVDAGKKLPLTDKVVLVVIEEEQPRWFLFMQGRIDVTVIGRDSYREAIGQGFKLKEKLRERGICLKVFRDPSTFWLGFNMEDEVLRSNKPLRQAISYAIDRQKYIDVFYHGRGEVAYGFIPPLMKSYDSSVKNLVGKNFDAAKAAELVKETKKIYGGKIPELRLSMPGTSSFYRQQGDFFRHCFNRIGLEVSIEYMDWPTFQEKIKNKDVQFFSMGWIGQYPDAENFLQVFYSKNISGTVNSFNYSNAEFDRIYEKASLMEESEERSELYRQAERIVIEDCPVVFLRHGVAYVLHHNWLKNYKPNSFGYGLSKYRGVDMAKRIAYQMVYD